MTIETQPILVKGPYTIDCTKPVGKDKKPLDDCEKEEVCAKIKAFNKGSKKKVNTKSKSYRKKRKVIGPKAQKAFREDCGESVGKSGPPSMKGKFLAECRYKEWAEPKADKGFRKPTMLEADHVQELQFGGKPGKSNLKWSSMRVNRFMGSRLRGYQPGNTSVKSYGCNCK